MFLLRGLGGVLGQLVEHVGAWWVRDVQVVGEGCAVGGGAGEWMLLVGFLCRDRQGRIWCEGGAMGLRWEKLKATLQEAGGPGSWHWKQGQLFAGPGAEPQAFSQPQASGWTGSPQRRDLATSGESVPEWLRERAADAGLPGALPACRLSPIYCGGPRLMTEMPTLRLSAVMAGPLLSSQFLCFDTPGGLHRAHS